MMGGKITTRPGKTKREVIRLQSNLSIQRSRVIG